MASGMGWCASVQGSTWASWRSVGAFEVSGRLCEEFYVTWPLAAAIGVVVWTLSLHLLNMTATSQSRGRRSPLEKLLWPWATDRACDRLPDLRRAVENNSVASLRRDEVIWKFLQREDVLYQASGRAFTIKATVQFMCTGAGASCCSLPHCRWSARPGGSLWPWARRLSRWRSLLLPSSSFWKQGWDAGPRKW